jgi:hypothetical protein
MERTRSFVFEETGHRYYIGRHPSKIVVVQGDSESIPKETGCSCDNCHNMFADVGGDSHGRAMG